MEARQKGAVLNLDGWKDGGSTAERQCLTPHLQSVPAQPDEARHVGGRAVEAVVDDRAQAAGDTGDDAGEDLVAHGGQGQAGRQAARQGKARQGKARQGKARQGKARQGKARKGKERKGKERNGAALDTILIRVEAREKPHDGQVPCCCY
eukprot:SAG22_NODE_152_length_17377_cov_191.856928_16_plen_150_part_00